MKTYLMALLAAVMTLTGTSILAAEEVASSQSSQTPSVEAGTQKAGAEQAPEEQAPVSKEVTQYNRNTSNKPRPKDLDFRHCLELESNAAIAQCAQE